MLKPPRAEPVARAARNPSNANSSKCANLSHGAGRPTCDPLRLENHHIPPEYRIVSNHQPSFKFDPLHDVRPVQSAFQRPILDAKKRRDFRHDRLEVQDSKNLRRLPANAKSQTRGFRRARRDDASQARASQEKPQSVNLVRSVRAVRSNSSRSETPEPQPSVRRSPRRVQPARAPTRGTVRCPSPNPLWQCRGDQYSNAQEDSVFSTQSCLASLPPNFYPRTISSATG